MFDLNTGLTLENYLNEGAPEEVARIEVAFSRTTYSGLFEDVVRNLPGVTVVVFVELFCPDAAVLLSYLRRISELNDQIRILLFPVKGNEPLLQKLTGAVKIPTMMVLDEMGLPSAFYVEYPEAFKDSLIPLDGESRRNLLRDFREGKKGALVEKDLVRLLKG